MNSGDPLTGKRILTAMSVLLPLLKIQPAVQTKLQSKNHEANRATVEFLYQDEFLIERSAQLSV